jgi:SAM-dependent methyltransferase
MGNGHDGAGYTERMVPDEVHSNDLVVSFETIEHVDSPAIFLDECVRVLTPEGTLILSTPNQLIYRGDKRQNPYHRVKFDADEFIQLLHTRFRSVRLYTQFNQLAGWWNLRSLSAERSPSLQIRRLWRLSSWLCPAIRSHVDSVICSAADDIILLRDNFPSSFFNRYIVRLRAEGSQERPYILVAVAECVKTAR